MAQCTLELDSQGLLSITLLTLDKMLDHQVTAFPPLYSQSNADADPQCGCEDNMKGELMGKVDPISGCCGHCVLPSFFVLEDFYEVYS